MRVGGSDGRYWMSIGERVVDGQCFPNGIFGFGRCLLRRHEPMNIVVVVESQTVVGNALVWIGRYRLVKWSIPLRNPTKVNLAMNNSCL